MKYIEHEEIEVSDNGESDEPKSGYDWCQRCGEETWCLERHQCEECGFTD